MKIIIVRHGETIENASRIIQGHLPGTLSEVGIEQAKKTGLELKDEKIDKIFSSDLARCFDTAVEIGKFHNVPIVKDKTIRERDWKDFQGVKKEDIPNWDEIKYDPNYSGAESLENVYNRAKDFLEKLKEAYPGENILIVGHDIINRALISIIGEQDWNYIQKIKTQVNAGINVFKLK